MSNDPLSSDARVPVQFVAPASSIELLADELLALGASAVAELDSERPDRVTLVADLSVADAARLGGDAGFVARHGLHEVRRLEEDRAWTGGWREHARAWTCGPRFVLRPPWVDAPPPDEAPDGRPGPPRLELLVDPGDAFGSGSHPTTRRCVQVVGELVHGGESVLDVGCGSGVLAVAAALAGAASVLAVDVDPEAVRVTPTVAARNGVAERVRVRAGSLEVVGGTFDVVLANLLVPIVEQLGAGLVAAVAPGGHLAVSGLLVEHRDRAERALRGLTVEQAHVDGDWLTLVLAAG